MQNNNDSNKDSNEDSNKDLESMTSLNKNLEDSVIENDKDQIHEFIDEIYKNNNCEITNKEIYRELMVLIQEIYEDISYEDKKKIKRWIRGYIKKSIHSENKIEIKEVDINSVPPHQKRSVEWLSNRVDELKLKPVFVQRSPEWYEAREGRLTASDFGNAVGECTYSNPKDLILKKCGIGKFVGNMFTLHGQKYEDIAIKCFEKRHKKEVIEFGLILHEEFNFLGASPDGITQDGIMLEIKCPLNRVINDTVPRHYWHQIQGQLDTCDLDTCVFLECRITEYDDEDAYLEDVYYDDSTEGEVISTRLNGRGLEKGVILEYKNTEDTSVYYYSPFGLIDDEIDNWVDEAMNTAKETGQELAYIGKSWWCLEVYSEKIVDRETSWRVKYVPMLDKFWKDVLYYRKVGVDTLMRKKKPVDPENKKERDVVSKKFGNYCMIEDSDDDDNFTISSEMTTIQEKVFPETKKETSKFDTCVIIDSDSN